MATEVAAVAVAVAPPATEVGDMSVEDYITATAAKHPTYMPHTAGRYQAKRSKKHLHNPLSSNKPPNSKRPKGSLPLQVQDDDVPDIPRGGGTSLSREVRNEVRAVVDKEFEAEHRVLKNTKKEKRAQNRNQSTEDDLGSLFGDGNKGKLPRFANRITLKVDKDRNRISLGMKNSYLRDEKVLESPSSDFDLVVDEPKSDSEKNDESDDPILADAESRALVPPLEVHLDEIDVEGQTVANVANDDTLEDKSIKRGKKRVREEREQEIRAAEERLLEKDIPRNADEFEKLIRSSPNSSFIWIKYMAFMLSLSDIDKARSIAERALRTINIREESEKLNIWVAYFNLENEYGNPPEEAVTKIFQRALQYCDPKKVHLALLGVYERTKEQKLADELLDKMARKFKHSCKVWLRRIQSVLMTRKSDGGIQGVVVNRALLSLPKHKHIKFISQTGILEFKCGVADRGRSLFEGMLLREYPKRTDLWSIYLDQEIRLGDVDVIRALFERAISLSLPPKKMKFLFKKYLEYEKSIGDEKRIEAVKKKAMDYIESTLA